MSRPRYLNRELSWLDFNERVLGEALDPRVPLWERLKFLGIFSSNLDEFLMVRVAGLVSQVRSQYDRPDPSGWRPADLLDRIAARIRELTARQYRCLREDVLPALEQHRFRFLTARTCPERLLEPLRQRFLDRLLPVLTPLAVDSSHPFPFLAGKSLHLLVLLTHPQRPGRHLHTIVPVPKLQRLVPVPGTREGTAIFLEELIRLFLPHLFPGSSILASCVFRITRDAELDIDEDDSSDLLSAIKKELRKRERGTPIRLETEAGADPRLLRFLTQRIPFHPGFHFSVEGPLDLSVFAAHRPASVPAELQDPPFPPVQPAWADTDDLFAAIGRKDRLLHLPYESFDPVVRFLQQAAQDPKVLAIKMTLYRTSGDSPVIAALKTAAENGKQVTVLVELKARFDEERNITWAQQLEQAGCHVVYGVPGLKTHAKACLVVRDEEEGIRRYLHLSTGNYNDRTARVYTDFGFFTNAEDFGADASALFNLLTGYAAPARWHTLVCAPDRLRTFVLERIRAERDHARSGGEARITAKMNSLTDPKVIDALYEASQAGVRIDLIVRGICCLLPGVPGLSETITVRSVVDRFLEHSRIWRFHNAGSPLHYLASADWMERNFDRRVELAFPVTDPDLKAELDACLEAALRDTEKARILLPDGTWTRPEPSEAAFRSQVGLYRRYGPAEDSTQS